MNKFQLIFAYIWILLLILGCIGVLIFMFWLAPLPLKGLVGAIVFIWITAWAIKTVTAYD